MARSKAVYQSLVHGILEADLMDPRVKEAELNTCVGLVNPAKSRPKDPISGNDPTSGELLHYPNQTRRDEESSRASRARNWKCRTREANEPQSIAMSKYDVGKRKAKSQG
ncbi:hypothetical protein U1Q18_038813 [Sarracenia purpurea var. burkii]